MAHTPLIRRGMLALLLLVLAAGLVPIRPGVAHAKPAQTPPPLGPVRFVPAAGAKLTIDAVFPKDPTVCQPNQPRDLIAAYPGTLEVGRLANGQLYLITELTFSDYLKGIAEVPASWPLAALEAQVVAARTYAVSHMNSGTVDGLNYNLCSTDACQVYRGLSVQDGAYGAQWAKAVDDTAGQILQYQGRPIDAFYFSTSNGHTYSNADVFGGTALPYLQPVPENDDGQSPTSHWSVTMPLADVSQALTLAGAWDGRAIDTVSLQGTNVAVAGGGKSTTMALTSFRNRLNNNATCLTPQRYPTAATGGGKLPQTVPSVWMTLTQQGSSIVMTGRGWGHGVGMVQYGAMGKAARGMSYSDILAYYYGGLRPVKVAEPGAIRILLATGVQQVTVAPSGAVQVQGGPAASGPVTVTGGPSMTIAAGGAIAPTLSLSAVTATAVAHPGAPATFWFSLNHAANVGLTFQQMGVSATGTVPLAPFTGGAQTLTWDPLAAGLPVGTYDVALVGDDGVTRVVSSPQQVVVGVPPPPSPSPSPAAALAKSPGARSKGGVPPYLPYLLAGVVVLVLAAGAASVWSLRRRR